MPNGGTMAGICSSGIRVACLVALHLCYMVQLSIVRGMDVRTHRSREVLVEDVARHHGMKQDGIRAAYACPNPRQTLPDLIQVRRLVIVPNPPQIPGKCCMT